MGVNGGIGVVFDPKSTNRSNLRLMKKLNGFNTSVLRTKQHDKTAYA